MYPSLSLKLNFGRFGIDVGLSRTLKIELPCRRELNFHVFPVSAFNKDVWLNLERLGRLLGSTWSFLGASWPQLGRSWDQLGANLGAPGTNLAPTWALLEPSWDQLEPTLGYHGRSCNALGALLVTLGRLWTLQGRSRVDFGAPRRILASQRHDFDAYEPLSNILMVSTLLSVLSMIISM